VEKGGLMNRLNIYAGLSEVRDYWDFDANEGASNLNDILRTYLHRASRAIDRYTRKEFFHERRQSGLIIRQTVQRCALMNSF
jgi:hypothetical protein